MIVWKLIYDLKMEVLEEELGNLMTKEIQRGKNGKFSDKTNA